jgi:hypothetical protein
VPEPFTPRTRLPEVTSARPWTRWEVTLLLIPLLGFVSLASYKVHAPGLYYDEMFVLSPATGTPAYRTLLGVPLLISPYVGADKSWFYVPIFALFGVSAMSIRLPAILISCGTLVLGYSLVRRILTPRWALAFTVACALHPGFIFLTKVDWGPQILMLFLKALCLLLLFRWLEGTKRIFWWLFGIWAFGFLDKFNFIWLVVALLLATPAIYGTEILRKLRSIPVGVLVAAAIGVCAAGFVTLWIIFPLLQKPQISAFSDRLFHIWTLYKYTCTGLATASIWFKSVPAFPSWTGWGVLASTNILLLLTLLACAGGGGARNKVDSRALRFCLWCLLMFGIIFLEIALTPQSGGAHHTIMLFPFDLLACFSAAFLLANAISLKKRGLIILFEGCVLALWVASNLRSLEIHFHKFADINSFRGRFSPRIELLASYLNAKAEQVQTIYCVDWGIGMQLAAICQPDVRHKVRDSWPIFKDWSPQSPNAKATVDRLFSPQGKALYLSFTEENSVFPEARHNFAEMEKLAGTRIRPLTFAPAELRDTYEAFESYTVGTDQPTRQP